MGDPAGIGPEIIVKLHQTQPDADIIVFGDPDVLQSAADRLGRPVAIIEGRAPVPGALVVRRTAPTAIPVPIGEVSAAAGAAAHAAIMDAIHAARSGEIRAVVTAPIHKEALKAAGIPHPGHTEILADATGTRDFGMMLANDVLRVMLVSIHVPLTRAIALVTKESVLRTIRLADRGTRAFGIEKPRIAVAGLNPHAGENGLFGREEIDIIAPAVAAARAERFAVDGPFAPDTIFMRARQGAFDVVVAMYHDQGLIPIKYLGLDSGVNITIGLPFVRTSVDHGTAFDIAGQGVADPSSLIEAVRVADVMTTYGVNPFA
jgi:4-hydroxythreonine-4-phosphate dehydrogenase